MEVSIGTIVKYVLTEADAITINRRRNMLDKPNVMKSAQRHIGNHVESHQILPMIVTVIHDANYINGQVFLDGNDVLWVCSKKFDGNRKPGTWHLI